MNALKSHFIPDLIKEKWEGDQRTVCGIAAWYDNSTRELITVDGDAIPIVEDAGKATCKRCQNWMASRARPPLLPVAMLKRRRAGVAP